MNDKSALLDPSSLRALNMAITAIKRTVQNAPNTSDVGRGLQLVVGVERVKKRLETFGALLGDELSCEDYQNLEERASFNGHFLNYCEKLLFIQVTEYNVE